MAVLLLVGCRSKPVADHRPEWVQQAEAQLQGDPKWKVSGTGTGNSQGSFFGSARPTTEGGESERQDRRAASGGQSATPAPAPRGVQWGETKITVQVED